MSNYRLVEISKQPVSPAEMFNALLNSGPNPDEIELIEQLNHTTKTTKATRSQQRRTHKLFGPLPTGDLTKHAALARSSHGM